MTENLTVAKMVWLFWLQSNRFIKCSYYFVYSLTVLSNVQPFLKIVLNRDINCHGSKTRHVSNVAVQNHGIIKMSYLLTVISSNSDILPKLFYPVLFQYLIIFWVLIAKFIPIFLLFSCLLNWRQAKVKNTKRKGKKKS